jgi:hypothetical protein
MSALVHPLTAQGLELDNTPEAFGQLRSSTDIRHEPGALRDRMQSDGYLYLPGLVNTDEVLEARRVITERLQAAGYLDSEHPPIDAVAKPGTKVTFLPEVAKDNPALDKVLYAGPMMDFFTKFLGGPVLHYDFTWFRVVAPGLGAPPHADSPFMGRGTHRLYTAWTPMGDVDFEQGGLMILESSPTHAQRLQTYLNKDVDAYCTNGLYASEISSGQRWWGAFDGSLSKDPVGLRRKFGGRWLTSEYSVGDVLVFSVYTIHASLDNHSRYIRLSSDSRYQLASEPVDQRWVGPDPVGHGVAGKRGRIC